MCTVGYGDITPVTDYETLLSILHIFFSCAIFAYTINEIGAIYNE